MNRAEAPDVLASLFDDEGRSILAEGGKGSWSEALEGLPDGVFELEGPHHPGITLLTVARDLWNRAGDLRMATAATRGLMRYHVTMGGTENPDALIELGAMGAIAQRAGRIDQGAEMLEQAWHGLRSVVGGRDMRLAVVAGNLGLHYARTDQLEDAEHLLETALKIRQRLDPPSAANVAGQLGEVRLRLGKVDQGLEDLRTAWLASLDSLGETHPNTLKRTLMLARALNQAQRFRESAPLWRELYNHTKRGGNAEEVATIGHMLGQALYRSFKKEEGIRLLDEALRYARDHQRRTGQVHPRLPEWLDFRAQIEIDERRPNAAEGILLEAVEVQRHLTGEQSPEVARRLATVGTVIGRMGRIDEAMGYLETASSMLRTTQGPRHPWTQGATEALVDVLATKVDQIAGQDKAMARDLVRHAVQSAGMVLGFDHASIRNIQAIAAKHKLS